MTRFFLTCLMLLLSAHLYSAIPTNKLLKEVLKEGITVDLRDPVYCDGVLTTDQGGVITGPNIRVQARNLIYTRQDEIVTMEAEGQLLVEYGDYLLIGDRVEYDFVSETGVIYGGVCGADEWIFGGEQVNLLPGGTIFIREGYLTTSDRDHPNWRIQMRNVVFTPDYFITARDIRVKIGEVPILWFPILKVNLDWILDSPLRYRIRWGGKQGLRFGVIYEMFSTDTFKTFLRLDYRVNRGPSLGITTEYLSPSGRETLKTINYVARDTSIDDPTQKHRYRFSGVYTNSLMQDSLTVRLTYDKLSDQDMPTDYSDKGLDLKTAGRTQLLIRKQNDDLWIANFTTRVRVNTFQSLLQELPSLDLSPHPVVLGRSGIISENRANAGFLDYEYEKGLINVQNFRSIRFEYRHKLYRPIPMHTFTATPSAGLVFINYGSGPANSERTLLLGSFNLDLQTQLYRDFPLVRHTIVPYLQYQYITQPSSLPNEHFIFDINDGWFQLSSVRFGTRQLLYTKHPNGLFRNLTLDTYAYAFFASHNFSRTIPKLYTDLNWYTRSWWRNAIGVAWDTQQNQWSHFNVLTEFTFNENLAIATEYRHRNAFDWRKVDYYNFILDSYRPIQQLHDSILSDRRDTLLFDVFYRFLPNWALQIEMRHGWNRTTEPNYTEYEVDLMTTWQAAWDIRLSYQHRENDHRVALYVSLGLDKH